MTQQHRTQQPGSQSPSDLEAHEASVSTWFSTLERHDAPDTLRSAIFSAPKGLTQSSSGGRIPTGGRLLRMFPLGAWGVATAALVLLALGTGLFLETVDPVTSGSQATSPVSSASEDSLVIFQDPTMTLFHDLQTFDEMGVAPGELIADWQR